MANLSLNQANWESTELDESFDECISEYNRGSGVFLGFFYIQKIKIYKR